MAFKFITFALVIAAANAGLLPAPAVVQPAALIQQRLVQPAPVLQHVAQPILTKQVVDEYDPNPQYSYAYDVQDSLTGDSKTQSETRNGDVVQGQYSLIDADGYKRTVDYTADPIHGFNAVVNREPLGHAVVAPAPAVIAAKTVLPAAPVAVAHAAPIAHAAYAAPAAVTYAAHPAPLLRAAPLAAPVAYAAHSAPLAYAQPAPLLRAAPLGHYATYAH